MLCNWPLFKCRFNSAFHVQKSWELQWHSAYSMVESDGCDKKNIQWEHSRRVRICGASDYQTNRKQAPFTIRRLTVRIVWWECRDYFAEVCLGRFRSRSGWRSRAVIFFFFPLAWRLWKDNCSKEAIGKAGDGKSCTLLCPFLQKHTKWILHVLEVFSPFLAGSVSGLSATLSYVQTYVDTRVLIIPFQTPYPIPFHVFHPYINVIRNPTVLMSFMVIPSYNAASLTVPFS